MSDKRLIDQLTIMSSSDELSSEEATVMLNGAGAISRLTAALVAAEAKIARLREQNHSYVTDCAEIAVLAGLITKALSGIHDDYSVDPIGGSGRFSRTISPDGEAALNSALANLPAHASALVDVVEEAKEIAKLPGHTFDELRSALARLRSSSKETT